MDGINPQPKVFQSGRSHENQITGTAAKNNSRSQVILNNNFGEGDRSACHWAASVLNLSGAKGANTDLVQQRLGHLGEMRPGVNQSFELESAFWSGRISNGEFHVKCSHVRHILVAAPRCVNVSVSLMHIEASRFGLRQA